MRGLVMVQQSGDGNGRATHLCLTIQTISKQSFYSPKVRMNFFYTKSQRHELIIDNLENNRRVFLCMTFHHIFKGHTYSFSLVWKIKMVKTVLLRSLCFYVLLQGDMRWRQKERYILKEQN